MQDSTTVRVSLGTRDAVRNLAKDDGLTLDEEIKLLARAERQRRIGRALAAVAHDDDSSGWLDLGADTVSTNASG